MNISGNQVTVNKSAKDAFEFLSQVANFEQLMPENIDKFEVLGENGFIFALSGMPEIALEKKSQEPHHKIVLGAKSDKLLFTLTGTIDEVSSDQCNVNLEFSGDFNPMMAMMIKGPITKFIETLSENLGHI